MEEKIIASQGIVQSIRITDKAEIGREVVAHPSRQCVEWALCRAAVEDIEIGNDADQDAVILQDTTRLVQTSADRIGELPQSDDILHLK